MTHSMTPTSLVENSDSTKEEIVDEKLGKSLVAWARSEYAKMKSARSRDVMQWNYNLSMYYGKQYYDLGKTPTGNRLLKVPVAPKHKVRHTVNLIRPMIRSEIARMTSQDRKSVV